MSDELGAGMKERLIERFRVTQCWVAGKLGLDLCMCCGRWHWKTKMDKYLNGYCERCGGHVELDRIFRPAGKVGKWSLGEDGFHFEGWVVTGTSEEGNYTLPDGDPIYRGPAGPDDDVRFHGG